ncbi:NUDIX domain-containing protein [Benzoatithermus flavus]|uniref:ADP-ribose pyrophosphatase n=1 Tax=Benzoatithermus flavus TaxID=3108223 RepID=A0ABU8XTV8_9PROT
MSDQPEGKGRRVEILERERLHDGFFKLDRLKLRHERFAGGWTPPLSRELFIQRPAVVVLPYDPVQDRVVLVEQFRTGCLEHPGDPWLIEAPAGLIDTEETPEAVARREVREETGLEVGRLAPVCIYHSTPGGTTERVHAFVAEVTAPESGGVFGLPDEHEDIRTHVLAAEEAFAWVEAGRIIAANGLIPLMWLRIHRDRLRREWQRAAVSQP